MNVGLYPSVFLSIVVILSTTTTTTYGWTISGIINTKRTTTTSTTTTTLYASTTTTSSSSVSRTPPGVGNKPNWENRRRTQEYTVSEFLRSNENQPDASEMWECPLTRWDSEGYVYFIYIYIGHCILLLCYF
jgi:hypothetical protein